MNKNNEIMCRTATDFIRDFFKSYLEDRDFSRTQAALHPDISWVGTGAHEISMNYADSQTLLQAEANSWDGRFKIIDQWYQAIPISRTFCIVFGELKIVEDGLNTILLDMDSRFSMVCKQTSQGMKLYHAHFSVPNAAQAEDEFVHKSLVQEYNVLLEQKLHERTKMLKEKTLELETLANNVCGGVEICILDEDFTIQYCNNGFTDLTGYTQQDVQEILGSKHTAMQFAQDIPYARASFFRQIEATNTYTLEYRLMRKDGRVIWVLDKGIVIPNTGENAPKMIQCILTDVSLQKEQELLLAQKRFELETITNNVQAAIIRCDFDDKFIISFANDGFFRMVGYSKKQFEKERRNEIMQLIHKDDIQPMNNSLAQQLLVGNVTVHVNRLVRRDKAIVWVLAKGNVMQKAEGKREFHGVLTDISEQKRVEDELRISQKRYEIAIGFSDITMFEYNILTRDLTLFERDAKMYGVSTVIPNGCETMIARGVISAENADDYRQMYRKIHAGEPKAHCYVHTKDVSGALHEFELYLTNVFDNNGTPIRAIGVRKNVAQLRQLQKERDFSNTLTSNQLLIFESNITRDTIFSISEQWAHEAGINGIDKYSNLTTELITGNIAQEDRAVLNQKMSKQFIIEAYQKGQRLICIDYRRKIQSGAFHWFRMNVNIIKDSITEDICIRCYLVDIHDAKERELRASEEQKYYETMVAKSIAVYTFNITQNLVISGHEPLLLKLELAHSNQYDELLALVTKMVIHPEDKEAFLSLFSRDALLRQNQSGRREVISEHRRVHGDSYIWVRITAHLFVDPLNGDIKAFYFEEDIHESKLHSLEIIYKSEHDLLTGLFNKAYTEKRMTDFFATTEAALGKHAFFIIDTDNFKSINDNFGHAFGDVVLSQFASKINDLFRDDDILGRIGGDEFAVLMKNIQNEKTAYAKAQDICNRVRDAFTKNNQVFQISASVGVAFYDQHGKTYDELYEKSDTALYLSKQNGRSQFTVFSDAMQLIGLGANEIVFQSLCEPKKFDDNTTDYVFQILYESTDRLAAINSVLELIGKHYKVSRVSIFEQIPYAEYVQNTFEWCSPGITPFGVQSNDYYKALGAQYKNPFMQNGIYYIATSQAPENPNERALLADGAIYSQLQFSIVKNGDIHGLIGFDECKAFRTPTNKELSELRTIANMLGMFLMEMRAIETINATQNLALSIINGLTSYAYVCEPNSYELLFANEASKTLNPHPTKGKRCYEYFCNRTQPCENCPMTKMMHEGLSRCTMDVFNAQPGIHVIATACLIDWLDGSRKMCMVNCVDKDEIEQKGFAKD